MYTAIFSVLFFIIAGLFALCGWLRGRKYVWLFSATRLGAVVVALILSLILSPVIVNSVMGFAFDKILELDMMEDVRGIANDLPVMKEACCALVSMILAPILYLLLFWIVKKVLYIVSKIVLKVIYKKKASSDMIEATAEQGKKKKKKKLNVFRTTGPNPIGIACGIVGSLLIFFVIFVPLVGTFGVVDSVLSLVPANEPIVQTVQSISDAAVNNAVSRSVSTLGGKAVYNHLTTYEVGGHDVSLLAEVNLAGSVGNAITAVKDTDVPRNDAARAIRNVSPAFSDSSLVPAISADFLKSANAQWEKGQEYCGIKKPVLSESMSGLTDPLWALLANSSYETVKTDVGTVVEVLAIMVEQDALNTVKADALSIFENRELSSAVLVALLSNDHLSPLVGEIAEYGVQMLGDKLDVDLSGVEMDSSHLTDKTAEAHALANSLNEAVLVIRKVQTNGVELTESIGDIGPVLDAFSSTQTVGPDNAATILSGFLCAESVYTKIGFTLEEITSICNSINEKSRVQGYTPLMNSLARTVDVVKLAAKTDASKEEMSQKVEAMIKDMTPESAEVLQEISTPSMMQSHGVPEQSAEPTANMVSNLFGNLSAAKESGMSDEEYQKEAQATTDLLNLAINHNSGESDRLFGEGSATGKSASEYVDTVFDSVVVSQTLRETAYPTGEETTPVADPLNTGKNLSEEEKTQVLNALNEKWSTATEEEKASDDYQKTYLAIGSLINVPLQITDSGVVILPTT